MIPFNCILLFYFVAFTSYMNASSPNDLIPIHDTFSIKSEIIGENRVINVWTPNDYNINSDSLPMMYMADGGIEEDFPHLANTLDELIKQKKIKPLILVGIENTQRRRDLTGFTEVEEDKEIAPIVGGSDKFRIFIKEELFPEIDSRYRTTDKRSIIGESLSGLFVLETCFQAPDMFDNYIAFDPSLWWNNNYLITTAKKNLKTFPLSEKRIWFAGSNTTEISDLTKKLAEILKTESKATLRWYYSDEPQETHATIFRATKEKALIWAFE